MHVDVQHASMSGDGELDGLFAGLQRDALESLELHDGLCDFGDALVNVELRDFVAFVGAGVGDVDADLGSSTGEDLCGLDAEIAKPERRVAQPVAEGIQRLAGAERVGAVGGRLVVVEIGQHRRRSAGR